MTYRVRRKLTPFVEETIQEKLLSSFRASHIEEYDGSADPEEYLCKFENSIILHQYSDVIKCRVFVTTLVGSVQKWFQALRLESLTSFKDLSKTFLQHFASSKTYKQTTFSLFNLK